MQALCGHQVHMPRVRRRWDLVRDVYGCGVNLVCPLCVGIGQAAERKGFLQRYYWHEAPDDEQEDVDRTVNECLGDLGYPPQVF